MSRSKRHPGRDRILSILFVGLAVSSCSAAGRGTASKARAPLPPPYAGPVAGSPEYPNWPIAPVVSNLELIEVDEMPLEIIRARGSGGVAGAPRVVVQWPASERGVAFTVQPFPRGLDAWNHSPRKEIAAFAAQRLIFDPEDYVVPTIWPRCVPAGRWPSKIRAQIPTVAGSNCVLTTFALRLAKVKPTSENPYNAQRFRRDGAYAYYLSNLNLFTYLIDHRDAREGTFVVSKIKGRPQFFSVSNAASFDPWIVNPFVRNWHRIRVPAVRGDAVDRLRVLERPDLDFLAVAAQLAPDEAGRLRLVRPDPPRAPKSGVFVDDATLEVQLGLTTAEIDEMWARIQDLIRRVDDGSLPVF